MNSQEFGKIVRRHRKHYYGNNFALAAKDCKISKSTLSKIENGKTDPALSTIMKLHANLYFVVRIEQNV